ncbi:MAG: glycoside hydrolase family 2, partial [Eubacterium sp.]|nr:glycoside hydrolase family 2 [Eubacterium sp.]
MLLTKWGKELDKSCPLSEYPRPQFVRESYISLNGEWELSFFEKGTFKSLEEYEITVPFSPECPLSGVERELKKNEYMVYEKKFTLPENFNKGRVLLHFGAVDQIADITLNGRYIMRHEGGYTPFECEITKHLKDGENTLTVKCEDVCEDNEFSRGKQKTNRGGIWYSPQSGIWQSVWLESVPEEYIKSVRITPDFDREQVTFEFDGADDVNIRIYDGDNIIADTNERVIKIPDFKPWSPESPFLYDVIFTYKKDKVKSYFGMRKFS